MNILSSKIVDWKWWGALIISLFLSSLPFWLPEPDLKIDIPTVIEKVDLSSGQYGVSVKNFGQLPATNIRVFFDLNYWSGQNGNAPDISPGESLEFDFGSGLGFPGEIGEYVKKIVSGEKGGIAKIKIEYSWKQAFLFNRKTIKEYCAVINNDGIRYLQNSQTHRVCP